MMGMIQIRSFLALLGKFFNLLSGLGHNYILIEVSCALCYGYRVNF